MVDLPSVPRRLVTTETPRSSVTAADVAAPYAQFGKALDSLGEGLEDVSVVAAEQAAQNAVTRDSNGNLQVETLPPMTGRAGIAFNRLGKQSYLIQLGNQSSTEITKARAQYEGRPEDFRAWSEKYIGELESAQPDAAIRNAVSQTVGRQITETYNGLIAQRAKLDLQSANAATDAKILTLSDEIEVLARKGGTNTPDFIERVQDLDHLINEKVQNPLLAFPREKADRLRDEILTRAEGAAIIDRVETIYRSQGFDAARQHLREAVSALGVKLKSADKIEKQGLSWLRAEEAGFRGERDALSREWSAAKGQAETLPRETLIDMQERARAIGAVRVEQDIAVRLAAVDTVAALRGLPESERTRIAVTGKVNLPLADRIVGAESGNNPTARNPNSSAAGLGQFTRGTWLDVIKRNRPDIAAGKSDAELLALRTTGTPEAKALNREMVARYADENGRMMQAAGVPVNDASLYLAHFLGPGDAIKVLKADANQNLTGVVARGSIEANAGIFAKNQTAGALIAWAGRKVGVGEADLTQSRQGLVALGMLKRDIGRDLNDRITGLSSAVSRQEFPDPAEAETLLVQVHALGTPDQQRKVAELVAIAQYGQDFRKLPADKRESIISGLQERAKVGASQFERDLTGALVKADGAISTAYKNDPYGAAYRFSEGTPALAPIDWSKPDQAAATIRAKVQQQNTIRADQGLPEFSVLRPGEVVSLQSTLASGDAAAVGNAFAALGSLDTPTLFKTLDDPRIRDGVTGVMRVSDPEKYTAVMSSLDGIYARDPRAFAKAFGDDATHALMTWQSNTRYMDPKTLAAERARAASDPQVTARRKANEAEGLKLARKATVDDVVGMFDTSWGITPSVISENVTGSTPLAPVDADTRDALMGDYETIFARRYAETLDEDTARQQTVKMLGTKWARSDTNGGRLMLRAPETVYPQVNGSHDWMKRQFENDMIARLGPRFGGDWRIPSLAPGVPTPNWTATLVPDRRTETDAQGGRAASYQVVVTDHRSGKTDVIRDNNGNPLRYAFDPASEQEKARASFGRRREQLLLNEDIQRSLGDQPRAFGVP